MNIHSRKYLSHCFPACGLSLVFCLLSGVPTFSREALPRQEKHSQGTHHAQRGSKNALLWRIVKPGSEDTSYLFGTLHLLEQSYVDTLPHVIEYFEKSETVVGEMILDSSIRDELQSLLDTGESLQTRLTTKQYDSVSRAFGHIVGFPIALFDRYEPIAVYALLLEGLYAKKHPENTRTKIPMDLYFQRRAKKSGKQIIGLESLHDETDAMFDSIPATQQIKILLDLVRHQERELKQLERLVRDYQQGKIEGLLHADEIEEMGTSEADALIYERNRKWIDKLSEMLPHTRAFIAVGAGHLSGPKGLIEGLRRNGFHVDPVAMH